MSGSTLTGFTYIPDPSQGTPGLWNAIFSVMSQNIAEANAVGGIVSNISTVGMVTINANSNVTNYLALDDSSGARSNYIIGSQVGGTADGLNIYDASGQTMIVSFSKQSVRFFQNIVGPVFDTGGALSDTYNAATFIGSGSTLSGIQAAINQASVDGVSRVYVPASMYPYDASKISFITTVQMVREGGRQDIYDVVAYGATGDGVANDTAAVQSALSYTPTGGTVFIPSATFACDQIRTPSAVTLTINGDGVVRMRSAFTLAVVDALLYCQGQVLLEDVIIDGNNNGHGGVYLGSGAANSVVRGVTVRNIHDSATGGSTSAIYVAAASCIISDVLVQTLSTGSQANPSIPRAVTFDRGSDGGILSGLRGQNVNAVAVIAAPSIHMIDTTIDGAANDGLYCLSQSTGALIDGGNFNNVSNGVVFEGAHPTIRNFVISATTQLPLIGLNFDLTASNVVADNVRVYAPTIVAALAGTRISSTTINGVRLRNCVLTAGVDGNACLQFFAGTVLNLDVGGCYFEAHQLASSVTDEHFVIHTAGNAIFYSNNIFRIVDDSSTLTVGNKYRVSFPTLTAPSYWANNLLLTDSAHSAQIIAQTAVGNFLYVTGDANEVQSNVGYLRDVGFNGNVALRRAASTAAPTAGTWSQGDVVLMTTPASQGATGFMCVAPGTPGTWRQFGHLDVNANMPSFASITAGAGTALAPTFNFSSETSIGWYRSTTSTVALSYGTVDFTASGAVASLASITVKSGANNSCGTAVLSVGSIHVANTYVKAGDLIFLTDQTGGGTLGTLEINGITSSSGFTITSTNVADTSTVGWLIIHPS